MFNLLKSKPIIDDTSSRWLHDTFAWALEHFDDQYFSEKSQLILPNKVFFPDPANSVEQMADNVFKRVSQYCGLKNWPFELVAPQHYLPQNYQLQSPLIIQRGNQDDSAAINQVMPVGIDSLKVSYDPVQLNQPQVMVSNYAAMLASYLIGLSGSQVPGGPDYRAPAIEVLAIFMGFGVMFANTAYAFRGGCGSCHNHAANRTAVLSENESVYALALFGVLKGIDNKQVTPHLKSHLRGLYKKAVKQIKSNEEGLAPLALLCRPELIAQ